MSGKAKTLEDYKMLAIERGGKFLGSAIPKRIKDKTEEWLCGCGENVLMSFVALQKAKQFSCCNPLLRKTIDDYRAIALLNNCKYILDTIPENASTPTSGWACYNTRNHIEPNQWSTTYGSFASGKGCAQCAGNKPKILQNYIDLADSIGWEYILKEIPKNVHTPINGWLCELKHFITHTFSAIQGGDRCSECYGNRPRTLEDYKNIGIEEKVTYTLDYIPENTDTPIEGWKCINSHIYISTYGNIRDKRSCCWKCPKSGKSSYEIRIEKLLIEMKLDYNMEYHLAICPNYRYDFMILQNILIEADGSQHFKFKDFFQRDENEYIKGKNNDIWKTYYAIKSGYKLMRLDYKFMDSMDDAKLIEFINNAIRDFRMFITTNDKMYDWIYKAVFPVSNGNYDITSLLDSPILINFVDYMISVASTNIIPIINIVSANNRSIINIVSTNITPSINIKTPKLNLIK